MFENLLMLAQVVTAVFLVIVILLQRSDGGMGALGGEGGGAIMSGGGVGDALTRTTAILATLFMGISLAIAAQTTGTTGSVSVLDEVAPVVEDIAPAPVVPDTLPVTKEAKPE